MGGGSLWPHARRDRIYWGGSAERYLWLAMQLQRDPSIDRYDPVSEHTKSSVFQLLESIKCHSELGVDRVKSYKNSPFSVFGCA
jgi:hypothetical protein